MGMRAAAVAACRLTHKWAHAPFGGLQVACQEMKDGSLDLREAEEEGHGDLESSLYGTMLQRKQGTNAVRQFLSGKDLPKGCGHHALGRSERLWNWLIFSLIAQGRRAS